MATFKGHIETGSVLYFLAIWWLVNMFRDFRRCLRTGETYRSRISYASTIRNKKYPVECYLKVIFMIYCFLGEMFRYNFKVYFVRDGHFVRLHNLQHMSIYGLILVHGVTDLLCYYKLSPVLKEMKYITWVVSFFWFGVQIFYHSADDTHKPPLENMIHRLSLPAIFIMALAVLWEMRQRDTITPQLIKCLGFMTTGSWFITLSFILFEPFSMHVHHNPAWDQHDMKNVHFVTALYGFHIMVNIVAVMIVYTLVATHDKLVQRFRRLIGKEVKKRPQEYLNGFGLGTTENYKLLEDEETDRE